MVQGDRCYVGYRVFAHETVFQTKKLGKQKRNGRRYDEKKTLHNTETRIKSNSQYHFPCHDIGNSFACKHAATKVSRYSLLIRNKVASCIHPAIHPCATHARRNINTGQHKIEKFTPLISSESSSSSDSSESDSEKFTGVYWSLCGQ